MTGPFVNTEWEDV